MIGTDTGKPKEHQQQQAKADPVGGLGVAFMSPNKKSKGPWSVCHVCGKQHSGGWKKYNQILELVRANIGKLVDAGTFDDKSGGGGGDKPTTARTTGGNKPTK